MYFCKNLSVCIGLLFVFVCYPVYSNTIANGTIAVNTTWGQSGSPYNIDNSVQVAPNVTLTIEAGVVITGGAIEVFGILDTNGASNEKVIFDGVSVSLGDNSSEPHSLIDIEFAEFNGGSLYGATGTAVYRTLQLRDSTLENIPYIYLWYPTSTSNIERNVFINSGGISVGVSPLCQNSCRP